MTTQLFEKTKHIHAVGPRALSQRQIENQVRFLFIGKALAAAAGAVALSFGLASAFDTEQGFPDTSGQMSRVVLSTEYRPDQEAVNHAYVGGGKHVERVLVTEKTLNECARAMRDGCNQFVVTKTKQGVLISAPSDLSASASGMSSARQHLSEWRKQKSDEGQATRDASEHLQTSVYSRID